jgi:hypothetical protein
VGVNGLARTPNKGTEPTMTGKGAWEQAGLATMIRSRMLLSEQRLSQYVDGANIHRRGHQSFVVTDDQWTLANAAPDGRKKDVMNGRNATKIANLFGCMARLGVRATYYE